MANPSLNIDIILTNDINIRKKRFVRTIEEYSFVYKMPLIINIKKLIFKNQTKANGQRNCPFFL